MRMLKLLTIPLMLLSLNACIFDHTQSLDQDQFSWNAQSSNGYFENKAFGDSIAIIPRPAQLILAQGRYHLRNQLLVYAPEMNSSLAEYSKGLSMGALKVGWTSVPDHAGIKIARDSNLALEAYRIDIDSSGIKVAARDSNGAFWAMQSLAQMMIIDSSSPSQLSLPAVSILDSASASWRGSMFDIARHYFPKASILSHLNRMARLKLNRLHLHLSDDQGWRLEIKSRPLLTSIGGISQVGGSPASYLSQSDYSEIVQYATQLHIAIIPEFDMPGHVIAAQRAYPDELTCDSIAPAPYIGTDVPHSKFCLTNNKYQALVQDVLREVIALTPTPWIHIGGDEVSDTGYGTFVRWISGQVRNAGKIPVGWQDANNYGGAGMVSQIWLTSWTSTAVAAANLNEQVLLSPCNFTYLDQAAYAGQTGTSTWCGVVSLPKIFSFAWDSIPTKSIGIESPLWTEWVPDQATVDQRFWPRQAAIAEIAWTPRSLRDSNNFKSRWAQKSSWITAP